MKKKKILAMLVVSVMVLGLVACGTSDGESKDKQGTEKDGKVSEGEKKDSEKDGLIFGYVVNDMGHEWYQNIIKGAQARAKELGIELKVADSAMDVAKQVSQIENLLTEGVDVQIITPVDVKALAGVVSDANASNIPIVTESNVVDGAITYVGIDNVSGGKKAGIWFADYAKKNNIDPKILIVGFPAFGDCRQRVEGFKAGLDESGIKYEIVQEVDGQGTKETSLKVSQDALTAHPEVNVIFGINDNSTTGGMAAYKEAGLDESKLTAIGFGFEGVAGREALLSDGPYKAAVAMFPDYVGVSLIDAALKAANGEELPDNYESGTVVITQENFSDFYTKDGDKYITNFDAIRALMDK